MSEDESASEETTEEGLEEGEETVEESELERRACCDKEGHVLVYSEEELEDYVRWSMEQGLEEDEARAQYELVRPSHKRKEYEHNWADGKTIGKRTEGMSKNPLKYAREAWHIAKSLLMPRSKENPYEAIDNGAKVLYLPGYLSDPRNAHALENELGEPMAYVDTTNLEEIRKVVKYAAEKQGGFREAIGFSDGGKILQDYMDRYGWIADRVYPVAANPMREINPRIIPVVGDMDFLAAMEKEYAYHDKGFDGTKPKVINGAHAGIAITSGPNRQLANIIKSNRPLTFNQEYGNYHPFDKAA